jgi:ParB-like chromosome segregation protein Spo0J
LSVRIEEIPVDKIFVSELNSRGILEFEKLPKEYKEYLEELARSIDEVGLIHEVEVWKTDDKYELLIGQNRFLAIKYILRKDKIRAKIVEAPSRIDALRRSLIENVHRKDLPLKVLRDKVDLLYQELMTSGRVPLERIPEEIAKLVGKSLAWVKDLIALRLAPDKLIELVDAKQISKSDVIMIVGIWYPNDEYMVRAGKKVSRMSRDERNAFFDTAWELADKLGKAPDPDEVEVVPPERIPLRVHIHSRLIPVLEKAAEDYGVDSKEAMAAIAITEWLRDRYGGP